LTAPGWCATIEQRQLQATSEWIMANHRHPSQNEEPQRVLGIPIRDVGHRARGGEERQRVLGFPVDSFGPGPAQREQLRALAHPIRTYKRWLRHRRLGPYATDEDDS
jgi:hypothetical protein